MSSSIGLPSGLRMASVEYLSRFSRAMRARLLENRGLRPATSCVAPADGDFAVVLGPEASRKLRAKGTNVAKSRCCVSLPLESKTACTNLGVLTCLCHGCGKEPRIPNRA